MPKSMKVQRVENALFMFTLKIIFLGSKWYLNNFFSPNGSGMSRMDMPSLNCASPTRSDKAQLKKMPIQGLFLKA